MHAHVSSIAIMAAVLAGAACGPREFPHCSTSEECSPYATCQNTYCVLLGEGKRRLPEACKPPENASATCVDQTCGFMCNAGYHAAGQSCVAERAIGGTVSGLTGSGLALQLNGGHDLAVSATATAFQFPDIFSDGFAYEVTVKAQPHDPAQTCMVSGGRGVLAGEDADLTVTCAQYGISGVISGAMLSGVTVTLSGSSSATTSTDLSGKYTFAVTDGSYTVTPSLTGYTFSPGSVSVSVSGGDLTGQDFTVSAKPWSSFEGGGASTIYAVWGSGPNDVWAVGAGETLHWNGSAWYAVSNTSNDLFGIWGSGASDVWAVGVDGNIMHWDGTTWSTTWLDTEKGTTDLLYAVWGSGPSDVWAVGSIYFKGSRILHWNGSAWSTISSPGGARALYSVWGSGANDVWAVGGEGTILHWDGNAWSSVTTGTNTTNGLTGVWGSRANDVWVVGTRGTMLHWNGSVWSNVPAGTAKDLFAIWGTGPTDIWAVGSGTVVHWNGSEWSTAPCGATTVLHAVWGSGVSDVWAVGDTGSIWHGP